MRRWSAADLFHVVGAWSGCLTGAAASAVIPHYRQQQLICYVSSGLEKDFNLRQVCGLRRHTTTSVFSQCNKQRVWMTVTRRQRHTVGGEKQNRGGLDSSSSTETQSVLRLKLPSRCQIDNICPFHRGSPVSSTSCLCLSFRPQHSSSFFLTSSQHPIRALHSEGERRMKRSGSERTGVWTGPQDW